MAIIPSGIWPIDPTVTSGSELAAYLNDWVQAFNTQSANATRPPTIQRGGVWAKTLGATDIALMFYDGTTDHQIGSIIGGKASFGGGTNAGTAPPTGAAAGDLWYDTGASLLKVYDGANWNTVSPPLTPITLDTANTRVGIDQATPAAVLDVNGDIRADDLTIGATAYPNAGPLSHRNKIINGAFQVWQRGTSFLPGVVVFGADRFAGFKAGASAGDYAQSTDVPAGQGFTYSGYFNNVDVRQTIELPAAGKQGVFVSGSKWTLSFWVKAGASGTSTVNLNWAEGVSALPGTVTPWGADQSYSYSTSWERKIVTFTVGGSISGSQSAVLLYISTAVDCYITGVQLEQGTTATPFEHRSYGEELALCQRYYETGEATHNYNTSTDRYLHVPFKVTKRASPTVTRTSNGAISGGTAGTTVFSPAVNGFYWFYAGSNNILGGNWTADAEL